MNKYKRGIDYKIVNHPYFRGKKLIEIDGVQYSPTVRCSYDKDYQYQAEAFLSFKNKDHIWLTIRADKLVEYNQ